MSASGSNPAGTVGNGSSIKADVKPAAKAALSHHHL